MFLIRNNKKGETLIFDLNANGLATEPIEQTAGEWSGISVVDQTNIHGEYSVFRGRRSLTANKPSNYNIKLEVAQPMAFAYRTRGVDFDNDGNDIGKFGNHMRHGYFKSTFYSNNTVTYDFTGATNIIYPTITLTSFLFSFF